MTDRLFGWVPLHRRSDAMLAAHDETLKAMPRFEIKGRQRYGKAVLLYDWSKAANGGKHLDCFRQETGSCVGQGGGKAIWTLAGVQAVKLGELISMTLPFYLVTYGKSRELCGMRGKGDGSTGSGFARAAKEFGVPLYANMLAGVVGDPALMQRDGIHPNAQGAKRIGEALAAIVAKALK